MDLNHVDLSPSLIAQLYGSVLIEETKSSAVVNPPGASRDEIITPSSIASAREEESLKYLGENRKQILIIVDHNNAVHIPDEELSFLVAMLTACKLTIADVAILNRNNAPSLGQKQLVERFRSRVVFLFGVEPVDFGLPMSFPEFQLQAFAGATYLYAPALAAFKDNAEVKRKLWEALKRLFVI